jgi:hypothetical protein
MVRYLSIFILCCFTTPLMAGEKIKVTVVVILASEKHKDVDKKIEAVAEELQKKDRNLTGFKLKKVLSESIPAGKSHTFKLPGDAEMNVSIHAQRDENGCATLTVKPPTLGEITYICKCERYFPVITKFYPNKDTDERMVLAIMATPCGKKDK